jgi:hypothetical protein
LKTDTALRRRYGGVMGSLETVQELFIGQKSVPHLVGEVLTPAWRKPLSNFPSLLSPDMAIWNIPTQCRRLLPLFLEVRLHYLIEEENRGVNAGLIGYARVCVCIRVREKRRGRTGKR